MCRTRQASHPLGGRNGLNVIHLLLEFLHLPPHCLDLFLYVHLEQGRVTGQLLLLTILGLLRVSLLLDLVVIPNRFDHVGCVVCRTEP